MSSSPQGVTNGSAPRYRYKLFGLEVASEICLFQTESEGGAPDVQILRRRFEYAPPEEVREGSSLVTSGSGWARFYWPEIGWAEVHQGREILLDPVPEAGPEILSHIVQGVAMGTLLDQRGTFTLHASAVAIEGRAVGVLGWKGYGKSTLCATLYGRGHGFVTDDVLALDGFAEGELTVRPGTAQMKLYPDSIEVSLGESADTLPRIWGPSPKRFRHVADGVEESLPLTAIYVLDFGGPDHERVTVEDLPAPAACIELIRHSYALRFLGRGGATPDHLARCAWLARNLPIRRLVRPRDVGRVRESAEAIEADVRGIAAASPALGAPVGR